MPHTTLTPRESGRAPITTNGQSLHIEYEVFGNKNHPSILLIMGLGTQLTAWPDDFVALLVANNLQVIRFDNRDIGLSSKIRDTKRISIPYAFLRARLGLSLKVPYTLDDMAADCVNLLDYLNIQQAHIAGASMGGMIAQLLACHYPQKTSSLISIMSTTGNRRLPMPKRKALKRLFMKPTSTDIETLIDFYSDTYRIIGSPGYPQTDEQLADRVRTGVTRSYYPNGTRQQLLAVMAAPNRTSKLKKLKKPALVIHGADDPLVPIAHGKATARHIPNAQLKVIPGMGHNLPSGLNKTLADIIAAHINTVEKTSLQ